MTWLPIWSWPVPEDAVSGVSRGRRSRDRIATKSKHQTSCSVKYGLEASLKIGRNSDKYEIAVVVGVSQSQCWPCSRFTAQWAGHLLEYKRWRCGPPVKVSTEPMAVQSAGARWVIMSSRPRAVNCDSITGRVLFEISRRPDYLGDLNVACGDDVGDLWTTSR